MKFNPGVIENVEFPTSTVHGLNDFTITMWMRQNSLITGGGYYHNPCFITFGNSVEYREAYFCYNNFCFKSEERPNTNRVPLNTWLHYALVRSVSGASIKIYFDGVLKNTFNGISTGSLNV